MFQVATQSSSDEEDEITSSVGSGDLHCSGPWSQEEEPVLKNAKTKKKELGAAKGGLKDDLMKFLNEARRELKQSQDVVADVFIYFFLCNSCSRTELSIESYSFLHIVQVLLCLCWRCQPVLPVVSSVRETPGPTGYTVPTMTSLESTGVTTNKRHS